MPTTPTYWFARKRYGWGWGLPIRWQGWAVLLGYIALCGLGVALRDHIGGPAAMRVWLLVCTALLVAICWRKGEPPRWQWGGE